ncbi:Por secretion system C-terminal sorting domain-containing protein [Catalinimonas alkaloidigena]|uniref:Por secretion system C-terminal sorting domain-containing protein n=2 Tax=Catalinimonas alkaloidigena TaxID=1075417 RepID=A0A1G9RRR7_9BACT|nr:Por secretion system C-terminal sorting domain-containing protein [Catalinimonas alkaloidigena]
MHKITILTGSLLLSATLHAQVNQEWVERYDNAQEGNDYATALTVDDAGNVYVTGYSLDNDTDYDYATVKYNAEGVVQWVSRYEQSGDDSPVAIAVDNSGNVYVTGYSYGGSTDYDYATVKYNASGTQLWVKRYNYSSINGYDSPSALAVDDAGNVYVTGQSYGGTTYNYDYATVKYSPSGTQLWVKRYNGPNVNQDVATALALDASGNVYVTGRSWNGSNNTKFDVATVKYDTGGNLKWTSRYNGPSNNNDQGVGVAVDNAGYVYVTGPSYGSSSTGLDYATVKYNATTGTQVWVNRFNGDDSNNDISTAIAVDYAGDVYVTGYSLDNSTDYDYATVKYNGSSGSQQWANTYNGPGNGADYAMDIDVDNSGNAYVTGFSLGSTSSFDYATVKYDNSTGNQLWEKRYDGPANSYDRAAALVTDDANNVYVTGFSNGGSGYGYDYATVKYSQPNCDIPPSFTASPTGPQSVNTEITLEAYFESYRPEGVSFDWGDGTTEPAEVLEGHTATASHTYLTAGVYTVNVTTEGGCEGYTYPYKYVVIYDPLAGSVSGAGSFTSPSNANPDSPASTGTAYFGFLVAYDEPDDTVPSGYTYLGLTVASVGEFLSEDFEWLAINDDNAIFQGTGKINGSGNYGFLISSIDSDLHSSSAPDMLRVKIWDQDAGGVVVYDTQSGADDNADPTTPVKMGDIQIDAYSSPLVRSASGAQATTNFSLSIYPNPVRDVLTVEADGSHSIRIFNTLGREVMRQEVVGQTEISVQHLPTGLYFLHSEGLPIQRIVKY